MNLYYTTIKTQNSDDGGTSKNEIISQQSTLRSVMETSVE